MQYRQATGVTTLVGRIIPILVSIVVINLPFQTTSAESANQFDRGPANPAARQVSEVLRRFNRLLSEKDMRVLSEFAEDAVLIGSDSGAVAVGRTQLKAFFERI